jgi:hypothetical protein
VKNRIADWLTSHPRLRLPLLAGYYTLVVLVLIAMYGRGDFTTPPFLYQGF